MSSPVVVISGGGVERRRHVTRSAPRHKGTDTAELAGWILFGAAAIGLILYLMRKSPSLSSYVPDLFGNVSASSVALSGPFAGQPVPELGQPQAVTVPGFPSGATCQKNADGSLDCAFPPGSYVPGGGDCITSPDGTTSCHYPAGLYMGY